MKMCTRIMFSLVLALCVTGITACERVREDTFVAFGTFLEVRSADHSAAAIVRREFARLQEIFDPYAPDSELSRLNRSAGVPANVSEDMLAVLVLAERVREETRGAFDARAGRLYALWKNPGPGTAPAYDPSPAGAPPMRADALPPLEIDIKRRRVIVPKGVRIDLSGIAKGYAVDRALARVREAGIKNVLINAGGEIKCAGTGPRGAWRIGVRDPVRAGEILRTLVLSDEAVATSGDYAQRYRDGEREYSHLIDPRSGEPVHNSLRSVTVLSESCAVADSVATALFVLGGDEIDRFLSRTSLPVKGCLTVSQKENETFLQEHKGAEE
ncbi:MAG: hypothetical protein GF333_06030 [Candidatus Omnitrophica bacterium]|nr:hypothetical protein [Candidatus Omnitrophota bacterium]